jgi:4,5:9,10-diseco-3-hydroxy-5,9,17-trioxoandrosta-1(10),2-diene-4-oate hydrolase
MTDYTPPDEFYYIHYARVGSGNPVLLLHGLGASHFGWDLLTPELVTAGYEVIAPDLPGHGDSYKPRRREMYHVENVFDTFTEWIESLELAGPPTLIGHSLGGYLALEYAVRHPSDVSGLVLIAPLYTRRQLSYMMRLALREAVINAFAMHRVPDWVYRGLVHLSSLTLFEGQGRGQDIPKEIRKQTVADFRRTAPGAYYLPYTSRNLEPYVDHVDVPALLIYGQRDRTLKPGLFPPLGGLLPAVRQLPLDAGHCPQHSHPGQVNSEILGFLGGLRTR